MMNGEYVLNPDYVFRNDKNRILLYSNNVNDNWKCYIHPMQAIALSFFRKDNPFSENIYSFASFFGVSEESAFNIISPFIENSNFLVVNLRGNKIKFPPRILVDKKIIGDRSFRSIGLEYFKCSSIDLKTRRCLLAPLSMTLLLTNSCITNCCYCYADKRPKNIQPLTTERILAIIEEADKLKMKSILLIGGEVFLHKDWQMILKCIIDKGIHLRPLSTKIPISENVIIGLKKAGFRSTLQLSIDAVDISLLKKMLGVNILYFEQVKAGIQLLDRSDIKYQIVTVITKYNTNYSCIKELFDYLNSLRNIQSWRIAPAFKSAYMDNDSYKNIKASRNDVELLFDRVKKEIVPYSKFDVILDYNSLNKNFYKGENGCRSFYGGVCSILQDEIIVLPDGKVTVCDQLYWNEKFIIGDLAKSSIEEVWNSDRVREILDQKQSLVKEASACKKCDIFDSCFAYRCWVDVIKAYGDDNMDYPDPRCIKAPPMINDISY